MNDEINDWQYADHSGDGYLPKKVPLTLLWISRKGDYGMLTSTTGENVSSVIRAVEYRVLFSKLI